ncbi:MAG: DUF2778 domain-containing protein [Burkholderiaceae bacterium]|nr:DUF2778 domain-containing protein [Burkholderiaceae bacterium]
MFECSFELNDQPMSTFKVGTASFPAFSGYGAYINKRASMCLPNLGPIPTGSYYIIDRQSGGRLGWLWDQVRGHADRFALYAIDGRMDDQTYCNQVLRGNFRLHPKTGAGISQGCITIAEPHNFARIRATLKSSAILSLRAADGKTLQAYGKVLVK